jgi:hypothetical protein
MKTILRRENVWDITKNHVQLAKLPTTMLGTKYIEKNVRKKSLFYMVYNCKQFV